MLFSYPYERSQEWSLKCRSARNARARTFLQVLACLVFSRGKVFEKCLLLAKLIFVNAHAHKEIRCARMLAKTI